MWPPLKLAAARPDWTILLIENRAHAGRGVAYGDCAPQHLLNVPAARMEVGLKPGFVDWLRGRPELLREALDESKGVLGDAYVPRWLFGDYIEQRLAEALRTGGIRRVFGEAVGVTVRPRRIVLAGTLALELVARDRPGARVMLLGSPSLHAFAAALGLAVDDRQPDVVVVGRDRRFSYERLCLAANAVRAGAALVVANPDLTHPGTAGSIVPETGAILAAILACTGPTAHRIVGKPEHTLFLAGLEQLGCAPHEAVMIGDNVETDGRGAERLGMHFIRVQPHIEQLA